MENTMGQDFSNVNIHKESKQATDAGALAYAQGNDVHFAPGQFKPETKEGQELIGHELAHVKQQREGRVKPTKMLGKGMAVNDDPALEKEADDLGRKAANGEGKTTVSTTKNKDATATVQGKFVAQQFGGSTIDGWAENIPGYKLIKVILGKSPITGDAVKRTAENFIGGFMALLPGGNLLFKKLKDSGALTEAMNWLQAEVTKLGITWSYLKSLVNKIWDEISIWKGISGNIRVVRNILTPPYTRIKNFVIGIAVKIKEFILRGALKLAGAPVDMVMGILNKGKAVFAKILEDPIGFIKNLFTGMGDGLRNFVAKISVYLGGGLKDWLLGKLAENGIEVPQTWDLKGIFGLVTQVVGVTYQNIRAKIVKRLGPKGEEMVAKMEKAVEFVKELITKGPIALWEKVQESLSDIKDFIIGGIKSFIQTKVIKEGITFILGMLNPAGALVKAVQLLVRLINFLRENMERIASFVKRVFDSVVNIANGDLAGAAKMIEGALAKAVPIVISFAARLLGLGNLAKKIQEIIKKIGKRVRVAVDKVIAWLVDKAKAVWKKVAGKLGIGKEEKTDDGPDERTKEEKQEDLDAAMDEVQVIDKNPDTTKEDLDEKLPDIKNRYKLKRLDAVPIEGEKNYRIFAEVNPKEEKDIDVKKDPLAQVKDHFGSSIFKSKDIRTFLINKCSISRTTAQDRINEWKKSGVLFVHESKAGNRDTNKDMCLVSGQLPKTERPVKPDKRSAYGYSNPPHTSATGIKILLKGLIKEKDNSSPTGYKYNYSPGKENNLNYLQSNARFKCKRTGVPLKWGGKNIHLGHHPVGASQHWNSGGGVGPSKPGHTQTKAQNNSWNNNHENFWGPEEAKTSSGTGAGTEGYKTPSSTLDPSSHPMWWDPEHPSYQG